MNVLLEIELNEQNLIDCDENQLIEIIKDYLIDMHIHYFDYIKDSSITPILQFDIFYISQKKVEKLESYLNNDCIEFSLIELN